MLQYRHLHRKLVTEGTWWRIIKCISLNLSCWKVWLPLFSSPKIRRLICMNNNFVLASAWSSARNNLLSDIFARFADFFLKGALFSHSDCPENLWATEEGRARQVLRRFLLCFRDILVGWESWWNHAGQRGESSCWSVSTGRQITPKMHLCIFSLSTCEQGQRQSCKELTPHSLGRWKAHCILFAHHLLSARSVDPYMSAWTLKWTS